MKDEATTDVILMRRWHDTLAQLQYAVKDRPHDILACDAAIDPLIERAAELLPEVRKRKLRQRYAGTV